MKAEVGSIYDGRYKKMIRNKGACLSIVILIRDFPLGQNPIIPAQAGMTALMENMNL
jgi:hypothetical protein